MNTQRLVRGSRVQGTQRVLDSSDLRTVAHIKILSVIQRLSAYPDVLKAPSFVLKDIQQSMVVSSPQLSALVRHGKEVGVQL